MASYKIELTVLSSVHIGTGSNLDISKCDYIKFPDSNKIVIIDEKKLFSILCERGLEEQYFDFIQNARGSESSLYNFLISQRGFSVQVCSELIEKVKKYELEFNADKFYGIKPFVKDKITGKVYIPASSIKGIISTAIQAFKIAKKEWDFKTSKDNIKDIMKHISISDSSLIDLDNLFVSNVLYASPRKTKSLNQYYEMLKPGTKATFIIKINDKGPEFINSVQKILNSYCLLYEKHYAESFKCNNIKIVKADEGSVKCYLGAKTGFPTKSFYYQTDPASAPKKVADILNKQFRKLEGKHINSVGKAPSCIKCIKLGSQIVENGAVQLKISKLENV